MIQNKDVLQLILSELKWNLTLDMPSHIPLKLCFSSTLFVAVFVFFNFMIIMRESGWFVWKILYRCFILFYQKLQKDILAGIF